MPTDITLENYEEKRRELLENNSNLNGIILRDFEIRLDSYLTKLKEECLRSCDKNSLYEMKILTDEKLHSTRLYEFCRKLPKGADLHVHDMALLPLKELIPLLASCSEFFINKDRSSYDLKYLTDADDIPEGYMSFSDAIETGYYTYEDLLFNWTVEGAESSGMSVWDFFEILFERQAVLSDNPAFASKYYDRTFRYYCENGIMHVEIHLMLTESLEQSEEYVKVLREAYYRVRKDYPYFTVRIIGAGVKQDDEKIAFTKKCFLNASYVQEVVKDEFIPDRIENFVIGFDLVNEEDASLPLHAFASMLLKVKKQYPDMKLYIHGGESLDAENVNLIDAYLLGVSRAGHGLNLYRYPDLHSRYIRDEICLEVCPVSNQRLGYTTDLRIHPATEYLKSGMALSLCSDDPAYMENSTLTDDFFAAIINWNLGIGDIKQLGINSIMYSGLSEKQKYESLHSYNIMWNAFADNILTNRL